MTGWSHPLPVGTPVLVDAATHDVAGFVADAVGASPEDVARNPGRDFTATGWYLIRVPVLGGDPQTWEAPPLAVRPLAAPPAAR